nr:MAG TPA: hypothetical protein [Caudoviricetes sp.]
MLLFSEMPIQEDIQIESNWGCEYIDISIKSPAFITQSRKLVFYFLLRKSP